MASARVHSLPEPGLGNTSYLVEVGQGLAVALDPPRDVGAHLQTAERAAVKIVATLETHLHADFVTGGLELADAVGAEVIAPAGAALDTPHRPAREADVISVGDVEIKVLDTPGHTPEHVAYLVERPGEGGSLFSGGSVIAGGAARTDLISSDRTEQLARQQFHSFRRLARLPDETALYPTHGAGSFCSTGPVAGSAGTLGDQRLANPLLAIEDEDAFVRTLLSGYGSFPPYFLRLREVNRRGPALVRTLDEPRPISPEQAHELVREGSWLIDARPIAQWADEHPAGAVSISLRPAFAPWLGWAIPFNAPLVVLLDPDQVGEVVRQARRIGYDRLAGWIDGGIDAWVRAGLPISSTEMLDPDGTADANVTLVDVRQASEVAEARIPGAVHLELGDIIAGKVPNAERVVTFCAHGERSATATSILERRGISGANLAGGFAAWQRSGMPVEREGPV